LIEIYEIEKHLLDSYLLFEHIQIETQLVLNLTPNYRFDGRFVFLHILIFYTIKLILLLFDS